MRSDGGGAADSWVLGEFGRRLTQARRARRLSQEELAAAAGLTVDDLRSAEAGTYETNSDQLALLGQALGINPGDLFPPTGSEPPSP